ncbi:hypothetical protein BgiBS90_016012, partial [Biomphalaria glabrata]
RKMVILSLHHIQGAACAEEKKKGSVVDGAGANDNILINNLINVNKREVNV